MPLILYRVVGSLDAYPRDLQAQGGGTIAHTSDNLEMLINL